MLGLFFEVQRIEASGTIYIRADGSIDPPTAPISTLDNVTYIFTDDINDSIVIERSNIIIDGNGTTHQGSGFGSGFDLGVNNVTIKSTNIKNFSNGIFVHSSYLDVISGNNITASGDRDIFLGAPSGYNSISGNNIANSYEGICLDSSLGNSITENNITGNHVGILLDSSVDNDINGNDITNNDGGIVLIYSDSNSVSGNTFVNDGLVVGDSDGSVVTGNLVNGKPLVYLEEVSDYAVKDAGQVILVKCNNVTVESLNLSNTDVGVELFETNNARISGNSIIANNIQGIELDYSSNNSISGNNITDNYEGLFLGSSNYNNISGNNVMNNSNIGIFLYSSSNNSISGNDLKKNVYGIWLDSSFGNKCHHNNFIDNTYQAYSSGEQNVWDDGYPSGGNYWSDYTGMDLHNGPFQNLTGSDGIGDSQYLPAFQNVDHYPLMGMFYDFNATSEYSVQTICNSSISSFQFNGSSISFNVTGDNGTSGFCRICIPKALMNAPYKVYVNSTEVSYDLLPCSNETYSYLYFNYTHSTQEVIIISEFPSFLILPPFMIISLLYVITRKRFADKL